MSKLIKISKATKKLPDPVVAGITKCLAFIKERTPDNAVHKEVLALIMADLEDVIARLGTNSETNTVITQTGGVVFEDNVARVGYLVINAGRQEGSEDIVYTTMHYLPTDDDDNIIGIEPGVEE